MKNKINQINYLFIIFITILSVLLLFTSNLCYAQSFSFKSGVKQEAILFKNIKNLIIIPLHINGKGPYNFLLDTGVDPLIITDPKLIDILNPKDLQSIKINGVGSGPEINAYLSKEVSVTISEAHIDFIPTVILKENVFELSEYLGTKIYGLIGFYFFNSFIVKINYRTNRLKISVPTANKKIKGTKLDLQILENKPYINTLIKTSNLGEIAVKLIVDCGASHALSLEKYKDGVFPVPIPNISANLGVGLSGLISGYIGRVKNLKLGNYSLKNILTNFPDYYEIAAKTNIKDRSGNLGADLLKHFHVTFDYQNKAMYLKKNIAFKDLFEHDMSGIELYVEGSSGFSRYFINRIESNSPSEIAGFKVQDEILSINLVDVDDLSLDVISGILKAEDGKPVIIEILRNGRIIIKKIVLKRRV